jgi:hypothetical protein
MLFKFNPSRIDRYISTALNPARDKYELTKEKSKKIKTLKGLNMNNIRCNLLTGEHIKKSPTLKGLKYTMLLSEKIPANPQIKTIYSV